MWFFSSVWSWNSTLIGYCWVFVLRRMRDGSICMKKYGIEDRTNAKRGRNLTECVKKSVSAILVARSTFWGSGIARYSWTSKQCRSLTHNMIYINNRRSRVRCWRNIHIHRASTVCLILDYTDNFPDFRTSRKSVSKRFSLCLLPAAQPRPGFCIAVCACIVNNYFQCLAVLVLEICSKLICRKQRVLLLSVFDVFDI